MKKIALLNQIVIILMAGLILMASAPHAQAGGAVALLTGKNLAEEEAAPVATDFLGRTTPHGTFTGFLAAVGAGDYEKAAQFMDLSYLSHAAQLSRGPGLAKDLQSLLDKNGWISPASMISAEPAGNIHDGMPPELERVGTIRTKNASVELMLEQITGADKTMIWLISADNAKKIADLMDGATAPLINQILPGKLADLKWGGVPLLHWLAMAILIGTSYAVSWGIVRGVIKGARSILKKTKMREKRHIIDAFELPLRLYIMVWLFVMSGIYLGISVVVRQHFSQATVIVAWFSVALLVWRLINVIAEVSERRMMRKGKYGFSSIVGFFRRIAKFIFCVIVIIIVLDTSGVNVTAGIAALGIGGIALALGAQKTLENFIGSLAVVFDQPVRIGDVCKVGETMGTIEDIGMRSTRIRTPDRTLVTIPNADFSALRIENYAPRDRLLLRRIMGLRYDTSPEQVRAILKGIRSLLDSNPKVVKDVVPVRFIGFAVDALQIEIFVYIDTKDYNEFLVIQEDVMLGIMDIVQKSGTNFAYPPQNPPLTTQGAPS